MALEVEVIEGDESADDRGERRGNVRVVGCGVVDAAVDLVLVNLGVKGIAELRDAAGEFDDLFAGFDASDLKAVGGEPRFDGGNILIGGTELLAELIGGEPLVIGGFRAASWLELRLRTRCMRESGMESGATPRSLAALASGCT